MKIVKCSRLDFMFVPYLWKTLMDRLTENMEVAARVHTSLREPSEPIMKNGI